MSVANVKYLLISHIDSTFRVSVPPHGEDSDEEVQRSDQDASQKTRDLGADPELPGGTVYTVLVKEHLGIPQMCRRPLLERGISGFSCWTFDLHISFELEPFH
ncbi:hypothetical protein ILYODFUR_031513 [Ilyodon furcidens]|uniref:Uncharacterized protein n=1 Tax=Ilyodon furcidens TaxID=33524 RepID=A0ABV0VAL8_9TELE